MLVPFGPTFLEGFLLALRKVPTALSKAAAKTLAEEFFVSRARSWMETLSAKYSPKESHRLGHGDLQPL